MPIIGTMKLSTPLVVAASLLLSLALLITLSLFLAARGSGVAFAYPGFLLFAGFRYAAWYLPLYLLFAAFLVVLKELKPLLLYVASTAVVPVATAGFWLQILGEPPRSAAAEAFLNRFGTGGSSFILFLVLLLEGSIIYVLALKFLVKDRSDAGAAREPAGGEGNPLQQALTLPDRKGDDQGPAGPVESEGEDDEAWWEEFRRRREEGSPMPDLPEVPVLTALEREFPQPAREEPLEELPEEPLEELPEEPWENEVEEPEADFDDEIEDGFAEESDPEEEDPDETDEAEEEEPLMFPFRELRRASTEPGVEAPFDPDDDDEDFDDEEEDDIDVDVDLDDDADDVTDPPVSPNPSAPSTRTGASSKVVTAPAVVEPPREPRESRDRREPREPRIVPREATGPEVAKQVERAIANYQVPKDKLLDEYPDSKYWVIDEPTRQAAEILKETLKEFKIQAEVTGIRKGPVITMFEILPAPGVKLSKIVNLADNIALRLAASRVRIVAPIPGKHAVGIEVPNRKRSLVGFREMIDDESFNTDKMEVPVVLGKDITGETQIVDLVQTPHLLIAGATGSGKSVCVNSIICSILYKRSPQEVNLILIDPKIVELKLYNDIPHLLTPVITEAKKAFQALQYCLYEMERRYALLDSQGVRDIRSYNRKVKKKRLATRPLPYLVVIIDEFADLMATTGKELESTLARLAAMSRAVGIHIVLATQRPSIDVITGLIKANIPSRIAFMVAGKFDSRIIIDAVGAEKLLGRGDMLFTSAWDPVPVRIQGAFLSEDEVERISDYVKTLGEPEYIDDEIFIDDDGESFFDSAADGDDPMMDKALEIVASAGKASASYLQRRLKIGYNRAARLVEEMEERGIVGPQNGSKPRELIHMPDRFRETGESPGSGGIEGSGDVYRDEADNSDDTAEDEGDEA